MELIMCIDDDPITLMLFKKVVQKASFSEEIITASNGQDAITQINTINNDISNQKKKPQLIFLDLNMPVMGGWEFIDLFNSSYSLNLNNTKIIILTSTIDPEDIKKSKSYPNVIEFLPKPITIEMLNHLKTKL